MPVELEKAGLSPRLSSRSTIRYRLTSNNSANIPMTTCTTFMRTFRICISAIAAISLCLSAGAQVKPPTDSWPTYHGDYSGQRHSPLTQITPENVNQLTQVWRFQTGQNQQIKATPILVNGVIYISTPD